MSLLQDTSLLLIRQIKEKLEIFTGIEAKNRYQIMSPDNGAVLFDVVEDDSGFLLRMILRSRRPFVMPMVAANGRERYELRRPFRIYFDRMEIFGPGEQLLGVIEKKFSWTKRLLEVQDKTGRVIMEIIGPLFHPWTFQITQNGKELGKISKKWSGVLQEGFTDADNFGVEFPKELSVEQKAVILGAVFLIDFVYFER